MNIRMIGTAAAVSALMVAGCNKQDKAPVTTPAATEPAAAAAVAEDPATILISVNGKNLTAGDLNKDIDAILKTQGANIPADRIEDAKKYFRNQLAQTFLSKQVLLAEADKKGIKISDADMKDMEEKFLKSTAGQPNAPKSLKEVAEKSPFGAERGMQDFTEGMKIQKLIEQEIFSKITVEPTEVQAIMDQVKKGNEAIEAKNAKLCKDDAAAEAKIKEIKAELDKGAKFGDLAKKYSCCPSSEKDGSLGEFRRGMMVPEFDKAAFEAEVGKVVGPVKTQFGQHLILVTKKTPEVKNDKGDVTTPESVEASHILVMSGEPTPTQPLPDVKEVEDYLKQQKGGEQVRTYIQGLMAKSGAKCPGFPALAPVEETAEEVKEAATEKAKESVQKLEADLKKVEVPAAK